MCSGAIWRIQTCCHLQQLIHARDVCKVLKLRVFSANLLRTRLKAQQNYETHLCRLWIFLDAFLQNEKKGQRSDYLHERRLGREARLEKLSTSLDLHKQQTKPQLYSMFIVTKGPCFCSVVSLRDLRVDFHLLNPHGSSWCSDLPVLHENEKKEAITKMQMLQMPLLFHQQCLQHHLWVSDLITDVSPSSVTVPLLQSHGFSGKVTSETARKK